MSDEHRSGRRTFLQRIAGMALATVAPRPVFAQVDQGIGGTGVVSEPSEPDQGIGGTGVIGTIRRFGSIVVNDMRISYAPGVPVSLDGERASAAALKIGHVVRVVATQGKGGLSTRRIDVASEVVGPIESLSGKRMTVLGQSVSLEGVNAPAGYKIGDHVGVSGLRRVDGTIVASLVEPRSATINSVSGPVVRGRDGALRIGRLRLTGLGGTWAGQRAILTGRPGAVFAVTSARTEQELLGSGIRRLSVEDYAERRGSGLQFGSGRKVAGDAAVIGTGKAAHAVITSTVGRDGRLRLDSVQSTSDGKRRRSGPEPTRKSDPPGGGPEKGGVPSPQDLQKDGIGDRRPSDSGPGDHSSRGRGGSHGSGHHGGRH